MLTLMGVAALFFAFPFSFLTPNEMSSLPEPKGITPQRAEESKEESLECIGAVGGTDEQTIGIIKNLLSANSIDCFVGGLEIFDVKVEGKCADRARGILLGNSARFRGNWCYLRQPDGTWINLGDD
jgi:hypothetical protein